MTKKSMNDLAGVALRLVLAFVFVFGQIAWAAQGQNAMNKSSSNAAAKAKQAPANPSTASGANAKLSGQEETASEENSSTQENSQRGGRHEGIKVHGHWTIEVRDPSGQVVTHREFENSLFPSPALASIFARQNSVGFWSVVLNPGTVCGNTNNAGCSIGEVGTSAAHNSSNLTATVVGNSFVLSGTVVAATGGTITTVETDGFGCPATIAPSAPCQFGTANFGFGADGGFIFTQANLSSGISVAAGQTISVTVNISFS